MLRRWMSIRRLKQASPDAADVMAMPCLCGMTFSRRKRFLAPANICNSVHVESLCFVVEYKFINFVVMSILRQRSKEK